MYFNISTVFLLGLVALVRSDDPEQLIGGREAVPGQFPYMASLRIQNFHICGGAIIDAHNILTAAHCVKAATNNVNINDVTVVTGTISRTQGGNTHRVAALFADPEYPGPNPDKDVGIVKLANPIVFDNLQQPISMATARPPEDQYAVISGWGAIAPPPSSQAAELLQYQYVHMIKFSECHNVYHDIVSAICTNNGANVGVCSGDSGSPLVYNNQVVGVTSRGVPCARGYPDLYSSTADNMNFLLRAMSWQS